MPISTAAAIPSVPAEPADTGTAAERNPRRRGHACVVAGRPGRGRRAAARMHALHLLYPYARGSQTWLYHSFHTHAPACAMPRRPRLRRWGARQRTWAVGSGHGLGSGGRLPTPRLPPSGKREMNNAPIWSNLETMVVPMPSDQMGTASHGVATVTRSHAKPTFELTPAVSQSNTERSQSR